MAFGRWYSVKMLSMRTVVACGFLVTIVRSQTPSDVDFCVHVASDWNVIKDDVGTLKNESAIVLRIRADMESLTNRLNDLDNKGQFDRVNQLPRERKV